jgi:SH2 domain
MRRRHYVKFDQYYQENDVNSRTERDKAQKKELAKKHFKTRMIVHPRFQNLTADEANEVQCCLIWNYILFYWVTKIILSNTVQIEFLKLFFSF